MCAEAAWTHKRCGRGMETPWPSEPPANDRKPASGNGQKIRFWTTYSRCQACSVRRPEKAGQFPLQRDCQASLFPACVLVGGIVQVHSKRSRKTGFPVWCRQSPPEKAALHRAHVDPCPIGCRKDAVHAMLDTSRTRQTQSSSLVTSRHACNADRRTGPIAAWPRSHYPKKDDVPASGVDHPLPNRRPPHGR